MKLICFTSFKQILKMIYEDTLQSYFVIKIFDHHEACNPPYFVYILDLINWGIWLRHDRGIPVEITRLLTAFQCMKSFGMLWTSWKWKKHKTIDCKDLTPFLCKGTPFCLFYCNLGRKMRFLIFLWFKACSFTTTRYINHVSLATLVE
jgi:hypothetical protein